MSFKWDNEKDDALKTLFENEYTDEEIADYFGLDDVYVVQRRRLRLKLLRRSPRGGQSSWSAEEIKQLEQTKNLPAIQASKIIGRTKYAIDYKRKQLGILGGYYKRWEPWQLQILREDYPKKGGRFVAQKTGRSISDVHNKASQEMLRREM